MNRRRSNHYIMYCGGLPPTCPPEDQRIIQVFAEGEREQRRRVCPTALSCREYMEDSPFSQGLGAAASPCIRRQSNCFRKLLVFYPANSLVFCTPSPVIFRGFGGVLRRDFQTYGNEKARGSQRYQNLLNMSCGNIREKKIRIIFI